MIFTQICLFSESLYLTEKRLYQHANSPHRSLYISFILYYGKFEYDRDIREINHHVLRQTASVSLHSIFRFTFPVQSFNKSIRKIIHTFMIERETTHFDVQTANARRRKWDFCRLREKQT